MKRCTKCKKVKGEEEFGNDKSRRDGLTCWCAECWTAYRVENREKNRAYAAAYRIKNREKIRRSDAEYRAKNREKINSYAAKNRERQKWRAILRNYGLTQEAYYSILDAQGNACAICGRTEGEIIYHVDHNHNTGQVRGILCNGCNTGLGLFRDNPQSLHNAIDYIERA